MLNTYVDNIYVDFIFKTQMDDSLQVQMRKLTTFQDNGFWIVCQIQRLKYFLDVLLDFLLYLFTQI